MNMGTNAEQRFDVIIVGGGLAGLALAVALRNSGLTLALVEGRLPQAPTGWDNRVYAISPGNARFLDDIGIWRHFDLTGPASRIAPVETMSICGDGNGHLEFSAFDAGVGELAWIAESSLLQHELWETARRQGNLELFCPARPQMLDLAAPAAAQLTLDDGRVLSARLIVAADGADSWTRRAAGIEVEFHPYQQMGVVANLECTQAHHQTAFQWFRRDGVLAWLPLPGRRISMVWSTPERHATELLGLPADLLCQRVAQAGSEQLGELSLLTPAAAFPLRLMRAPRTVAARLALIGDAAHTIHPLSGHGINLGFKDAQALANLLRDRPAHVDCGDLRLLRAYERARAEEVLALQSVTHALHQLFQPDLSALSWLRNAGLNLTQSLPVIKGGLMRYALN
jgi:2-octaprenylphenol hydroxylase